jgi:molecular chaperone DnaJ
MFAIKDYYTILQVEPSATLQEIKKAYRKLALQLHPDKNNNDPWSAARFTEVKEAYEVLTNPAKKEYYLQQRWYNQSIGKKRTQDVITPVSILKQALELEKYVSTLDVFRLDKPGLQQYILDLFPASTVDQLHKFNEPGTIREIISLVLRSMHPLPQVMREKILSSLLHLSGTDQPALQLLQEYKARSAKKHRREKYSLVIIIAATFILCLLIWLAGR